MATGRRAWLPLAALLLLLLPAARAWHDHSDHDVDHDHDHELVHDHDHGVDGELEGGDESDFLRDLPPLSFGGGFPADWGGDFESLLQEKETHGARAGAEGGGKGGGKGGGGGGEGGLPAALDRRRQEYEAMIQRFSEAPDEMDEEDFEEWD